MTEDARRMRFETDCRARGVSWTYAASRPWRANHQKRHVWVPPPINDAMEAICRHELGHIIVGPCPKTGDHFRSPDGCLACEMLAWTSGGMPHTADGYAARRSALGTYRRGIPAFAAARTAADRMLGRVDALLDVQRKVRWAALQERNDRARAGLQRQR